MRRARPVVVPNSPPRSRMSAPTSSSSSVGNGPGADARGVGLGDAPDDVDVARPDARADAGGAGDRVRRRHERIGAVVEVEHRRLGALEDDRAAVVQAALRERGGVGDVLLDAVAEGQVVLGHALQVERGVLGERAQRQALGLERGGDLLLEDLLVEHVLHADAQARRLVGVAGPDPALRRPDRELAELGLAGRVEHQVVGHDQVRVGADAQARDVDALGPQPVDLVVEHARVDHDAVADHAQLAGVEDPARDEVEGPLLPVAHDRVAGVVAALEAHDHVGALGEEIDDLALALVAPLDAYDDDARHVRRSVSGDELARVFAVERHAACTSPPGARPSAR